MDKQQATEFILSRLELGYESAYIAEELSKQLKAPPTVVAKFVDQVASTLKPPPPPQPEPQSAREDIPSWIIDLEANGHPPEFVPEDVSRSQTTYETHKPYQGLNQPSLDWAQANTSISLSPAEVNLISTSQKESDLQELTSFVLDELKSQRRLNDIIETVCQRTGWHWNEAQRFVAKARTAHHGEISKTQNRFMIPFSIIFIVGGVLLLLWSIYALVDYYLGFTSPDRTNTLAVDFIPVVIGALITSFGIIAGGIYGLSRTLSSR